MQLAFHILKLLLRSTPGYLFALCTLIPATNGRGQAGRQEYENSVQTGKASFYHKGLQGNETSNGETYDMNDFTAAHRTLPFNSLVHIRNLKNNKSVIVRINDRGPFVKSRIIDLSGVAATKLGMVKYGVAPVSLRVLHLLDYVPLTDSSFSPGENWNCSADHTVLKGISVYVWKTEFWKQAFYMASNLILEEKFRDAVVRVIGSGSGRRYAILLTNIKSKDNALSEISKLKAAGYVHAAIFHP